VKAVHEGAEFELPRVDLTLARLAAPVRRLMGRRPLASLWLLYGTVGLAIAMANSPGWYVYDARFEHYWAPHRFLGQQVTLWDATRTLGRPTAFFSPVVGTLLTAFHALGASPPVAERLLHATYLGIAGVGMVCVLQLYRPRIGPEHVIAGFVYVINPYTTQFLVPSGLYLHAALSPLLVVMAVRGSRARDAWPWAAGFALLVASLGAVNTASLLYALLPVVPALAYEIWGSREVSIRRAAGWAGRALPLTLLTCIAALYVLMANAPLIAENLGTTELPRLVSSRSSWAESWRGLGSWMSYVNIQGDALRPGARLLFTSAPVILATFLLPAAALVALWRVRWRAGAAFAAMGFVALVAMVGVHPIDDPDPVGAALDALYDRVLFARSLRNGYKAGPGLLMFVAALVAVGVVELGRSWASVPRRRAARAVAGAGLVAIVALAAIPYWTDGLYSDRDRSAGIPDYWT
jgi:hypothetical protein